MRVSVDGQDLFTLSEIQKRVIKNDLQDDGFEEDMKRRLKWIWEHKYEQCFKRLRQEWEPKLIDRGIDMLPAKDDAFATLVFSQVDYKNRTQREQEEALKRAQEG